MVRDKIKMAEVITIYDEPKKSQENRPKSNPRKVFAGSALKKTLHLFDKNVEHAVNMHQNDELVLPGEMKEDKHCTSADQSHSSNGLNKTISKAAYVMDRNEPDMHSKKRENRKTRYSPEVVCISDDSNDGFKTNAIGLNNHETRLAQEPNNMQTAQSLPKNLIQGKNCRTSRKRSNSLRDSEFSISSALHIPSNKRSRKDKSSNKRVSFQIVPSVTQSETLNNKYVPKVILQREKIPTANENSRNNIKETDISNYDFPMSNKLESASSVLDSLQVKTKISNPGYKLSNGRVPKQNSSRHWNFSSPASKPSIIKTNVKTAHKDEKKSFPLYTDNNENSPGNVRCSKEGDITRNCSESSLELLSKKIPNLEHSSTQNSITVCMNANKEGTNLKPAKKSNIKDTLLPYSEYQNCDIKDIVKIEMEDESYKPFEEKCPAVSEKIENCDSSFPLKNNNAMAENKHTTRSASKERVNTMLVGSPLQKQMNRRYTDIAANLPNSSGSGSYIQNETKIKEEKEQLMTSIDNDKSMCNEQVMSLSEGVCPFSTFYEPVKENNFDQHNSVVLGNRVVNSGEEIGAGLDQSNSPVIQNIKQENGNEGIWETQIKSLDRMNACAVGHNELNIYERNILTDIPTELNEFPGSGSEDSDEYCSGLAETSDIIESFISYSADNLGIINALDDSNDNGENPNVKQEPYDEAELLDYFPPEILVSDDSENENTFTSNGQVFPTDYNESWQTEKPHEYVSNVDTHFSDHVKQEKLPSNEIHDETCMYENINISDYYSPFTPGAPSLKLLGNGVDSEEPRTSSTGDTINSENAPFESESTIKSEPLNSSQEFCSPDELVPSYGVLSELNNQNSTPSTTEKYYDCSKEIVQNENFVSCKVESIPTSQQESDDVTNASYLYSSENCNFSNLKATDTPSGRGENTIFGSENTVNNITLLHTTKYASSTHSNKCVLDITETFPKTVNLQTSVTPLTNMNKSSLPRQIDTFSKLESEGNASALNSVSGACNEGNNLYNHGDVQIYSFQQEKTPRAMLPDISVYGMSYESVPSYESHRDANGSLNGLQSNIYYTDNAKSCNQSTTSDTWQLSNFSRLSIDLKEDSQENNIGLSAGSEEAQTNDGNLSTGLEESQINFNNLSTSVREPQMINDVNYFYPPKLSMNVTKSAVKDSFQCVTQPPTLFPVTSDKGASCRNGNTFPNLIPAFLRESSTGDSEVNDRSPLNFANGLRNIEKNDLPAFNTFTNKPKFSVDLQPYTTLSSEVLCNTNTVNNYLNTTVAENCYHSMGSSSHLNKSATNLNGTYFSIIPTCTESEITTDIVNVTASAPDDMTDQNALPASNEQISLQTELSSTASKTCESVVYSVADTKNSADLCKNEIPVEISSHRNSENSTAVEKIRLHAQHNQNGFQTPSATLQTGNLVEAPEQSDCFITEVVNICDSSEAMKSKCATEMCYYKPNMEVLNTEHNRETFRNVVANGTSKGTQNEHLNPSLMRNLLDAARSITGENSTIRNEATTKNEYFKNNHPCKSFDNTATTSNNSVRNHNFISSQKISSTSRENRINENKTAHSPKADSDDLVNKRVNTENIQNEMNESNQPFSAQVTFPTTSASNISSMRYNFITNQQSPSTCHATTTYDNRTSPSPNVENSGNVYLYPAGKWLQKNPFCSFSNQDFLHVYLEVNQNYALSRNDQDVLNCVNATLNDHRKEEQRNRSKQGIGYSANQRTYPSAQALYGATASTCDCNRCKQYYMGLCMRESEAIRERERYIQPYNLSNMNTDTTRVSLVSDRVLRPPLSFYSEDCFSPSERNEMANSNNSHSYLNSPSEINVRSYNLRNSYNLNRKYPAYSGYTTLLERGKSYTVPHSSQSTQMVDSPPSNSTLFERNKSYATPDSAQSSQMIDIIPSNASLFERRKNYAFPDSAHGSQIVDIPPSNPTLFERNKSYAMPDSAQSSQVIDILPSNASLFERSRSYAVADTAHGSQIVDIPPSITSLLELRKSYAVPYSAQNSEMVGTPPSNSSILTPPQSYLQTEPRPDAPLPSNESVMRHGNLDRRLRLGGSGNILKEKRNRAGFVNTLHYLPTANFVNSGNISIGTSDLNINNSQSQSDVSMNAENLTTLNSASSTQRNTLCGANNLYNNIFSATAYDSRYGRIGATSSVRQSQAPASNFNGSIVTSGGYPNISSQCNELLQRNNNPVYSPAARVTSYNVLSGETAMHDQLLNLHSNAYNSYFNGFPYASRNGNSTQVHSQSNIFDRNYLVQPNITTNYFSGENEDCNSGTLPSPSHRHASHNCLSNRVLGCNDVSSSQNIETVQQNSKDDSYSARNETSDFFDKLVRRGDLEEMRSIVLRPEYEHDHTPAIERAKAHLAYKEGRYNDLLKFLTSIIYPTVYHKDLQTLWIYAHCQESQKVSGKRLQPAQKHRVKKRFPFPRSISEVVDNRPVRNDYQNILSAEYARNQHPSAETRRILAERTGRTPEQVNTWFKNRRSRESRRFLF